VRTAAPWVEILRRLEKPKVDGARSWSFGEACRDGINDRLGAKREAEAIKKILGQACV